jgi:hypothetical protein
MAGTREHSAAQHSAAHLYDVSLLQAAHVGITHGGSHHLLQARKQSMDGGQEGRREA